MVNPTRRRVLLGAAGALAVPLWPHAARGASPLVDDPFTLGVASGEPVCDGFVIWTRLAPRPLEGGGMPDTAVPVLWEVALDDQFRSVVRRGEMLAQPAWGHSVHVGVDGLAPGRTYWYRFRAGGAQSPAGRALTAPASGAPLGRLRFAYASCQHYEHGHYAAYRHLAADAPDLVLHLGDYIYESRSADPVRRHEAGEPYTLAEYRNRYARYKLDADLQAAHAAAPWIVTWDDHEVDNDYAGVHDQDGSPPEVFARRCAAAYQAYWEHMPLRPAARPAGGRMRLYRRRAFGDLLAVHVLDTRQHRDDQACAPPGRRGGALVRDCAALSDPARSLLGAAQERWLARSLRAGGARWNVLAQSLMFAPLDQALGPGRAAWTDGWDGYRAARARLLEQLRDGAVANPVIVSGDIHSFWANEVHADPADPRSPVMASEFVGTSISSRGVDHAQFAQLLPENPHVRYFESRYRGYALAEFRADALEVALRAVDDARDPRSGVRTLARFRMEAGRPGLVRTDAS
jgi:alkaline phosphatase D